MQLKLPRRPRLFAARPVITRKTRPPANGELDDPWAGEDDAWDCDDDLKAEAPGDFMRLFRGAAVAVLLGLAFWAIALLLLLQLV